MMAHLVLLHIAARKRQTLQIVVLLCYLDITTSTMTTGWFAIAAIMTCDMASGCSEHGRVESVRCVGLASLVLLLCEEGCSY